MTGRIVRLGPHRCQPPTPETNGDIWRCDCGIHWICRTYPNTAWNRWQRITPFGAWVRRLA